MANLVLGLPTSADRAYVRGALAKLVAGFLFAALLAGVFLVGCWLLDELVSRHPFELVACLVALLLAATVLLFTGYWRLWFPWRAPKLVLADAFVILGLSWLFLTLAIIATHAALAANGVGSTKRATPDSGIVELTRRYYLWHILDAVPLLDVPDSLTWKRGNTYVDRTSGVLLLTYKLLVILPIIGIVAGSLKASDEPEVTDEERLRP